MESPVREIGRGFFIWELGYDGQSDHDRQEQIIQVDRAEACLSMPMVNRVGQAERNRYDSSFDERSKELNVSVPKGFRWPLFQGHRLKTRALSD
jgi:hypothetical protein